MATSYFPSSLDSTVTKNAAGIEEVVVQGDVSDEVVDLIEGGVGVFAGSGIGQGNVEVVEEKKKGAGS